MKKMVFTKENGPKEVVITDYSSDMLFFVASTHIVAENIYNKRTKRKLVGVIDSKGNELIEFDEDIRQVTKVNENIFIVERWVPLHGGSGTPSCVDVHELYRFKEGELKLLFTSDQPIHFSKEKDLVTYSTDKYNPVDVTSYGVVKGYTHNGKSTTHIYDMNSLEDKTLVYGSYKIVNDDDVIVISSEDGEYLYSISQNKKISAIFNKIYGNGESLLEGLIYYVIPIGDRGENIIGHLNCLIDKRGNYASLVANTYNGSCIDPRNPSFNLEDEAFKLRKQLEEYANYHKNGCLSKKLKPFVKKI